MKKESHDTPKSEEEGVDAQKMPGKQKPLKEKLLLGLVWDKIKFEREGGIRGELVVSV